MSSIFSRFLESQQEHHKHSERLLEQQHALLQKLEQNYLDVAAFASHLGREPWHIAAAVASLQELSAQQKELRQQLSALAVERMAVPQNLLQHIAVVPKTNVNQESSAESSVESSAGSSAESSVELSAESSATSSFPQTSLGARIE